MKSAQPDSCSVSSDGQLDTNACSNLEQRLDRLHGQVVPWLCIHHCSLHWPGSVLSDQNKTCEAQSKAMCSCHYMSCFSMAQEWHHMKRTRKMMKAAPCIFSR